MRRLTLSAPQNYLGALHLALLCLSGFNPSIQLVCLFRTKFDLGRHSTHPGIPSYIAYFCNEVLPYIYTEGELRRLFSAATSCRKDPRKLEPQTLRAILVLLYGAGLR